MTNINSINKLGLLSIMLLSSTFVQLSGMSYLSSFKNKLLSTNVTNYVKTSLLKPSAESVKKGFNYLKSNLQLSAQSAGVFVKNNPTLAKAIVIGSVGGLSLIHPAIRGTIYSGGWKTLKLLHGVFVNHVWPFVNGCFTIFSGVNTLMGSPENQGHRGPRLVNVTNEEKQDLNVIGQIADEFIRNVNSAADYKSDGAQAIINGPCPVEKMRPLLQQYENTRWAQTITQALDGENIKYNDGNLYSLVTLYARYMHYLSDLAKVHDITDEQLKEAQEDIKQTRDELIKYMEDVRGLVDRLVQ